MSNLQIVRTCENRIPIQTFQKWHNVSYRYVSYVKVRNNRYLENRCMVFRTFWEEGWRKPYVRPSKTDTVKARTVYRGCNVCYQIFLKNGKIDFKSKILNFNINFKALINSFTKPALKHRTKVILTSSNLILKRQIRFC